MEDIGNNPLEFKANGGVLSELSAFLSVSDDEFLPELHDIKEEMVEEVMQELLKEINGCSGDDKCDKDTSMAPVSVQVSPSTFIVPGGGNESCGPTFSDSASTVMAGIDVSGVKKGGPGLSSIGIVGTTEVIAGLDVVVLPAVARNGLWLVEGSDSTSEGCMQGGGGSDQAGGGKMEGCDAMEVEDEWLARVLSSDPQELEDWI